MQFQDPTYTTPAPTFSTQEIVFYRGDGDTLKLGLYEDLKWSPAKVSEGHIQGMFDQPIAHTWAQQDGPLAVTFTLQYASAIKFREWRGNMNHMLDIDIGVPGADGIRKLHTFRGWRQGGDENVDTAKGPEAIKVSFSGMALQHIGPNGKSDYDNYNSTLSVVVIG